MQRYTVRRSEEVDWIKRALERSGATIVRAPDGRTAPFEFVIGTPSGEELELVCYAFYAKRYEQAEGDRVRPENEHRFQIKYGNDLSGYHDVYIDPTGRKITLMFGVHIDLDLAIAVDPAMHNPTRFSVSVERVSP